LETFVLAARPSGSAGLRLRQLSGPTELAAAADLITEVFGADDPTPVDLLVAITCAGGFVGGAELDGRLIGCAMAFGEVAEPGSTHAPGLHSHVAAVRSTARGMQVGQQLKWYQRQWALERGIDVIHWTFDPLVRRNAVLNLNRLGAVATAYHEDFYGTIPDALNAGMASDRLLVRWNLTSARVQAAAAARPAVHTPPDPTVQPDPTEPADPTPLPDSDEPTGRTPVGTIATPTDIEDLVTHDPAAAQQWRARQRAEFAALPERWIVTGIDPDGRYQVEQT
jgi:predicted GNAT superfamily acetyltransferase